MAEPRSRWLLWQFIQRDTTSRFVGSRLGLLWALANPLAQLLVYGFVFSTVFKVRATGDGQTPFLLFVAVGLWPWMAFAEAVTRATGSVVQNAALIKKTPFRHDLVVYAAVLSSFALQIVGYVLVLAYFAFTEGQHLHAAGALRAAFTLSSLWLLAQGLGLLLASLQVFVRDIEQAVGPTLQMMFYLSPILYAATQAPDWVQALMSYNPIAAHADALRSAWLHGEALPTVRDAAAFVFAALIWLVGRWTFQRLSPHFEEAL